MTDGGGEGYIQRPEEGTMNVCRNTRTSSNTFQPGLTEINLLQLRGRAREKSSKSLDVSSKHDSKLSSIKTMQSASFGTPTNKQHRSLQHKGLLLSQRLIHTL